MTPIPKVGQVPWRKPGFRAPMGAIVRTLLGLLGLLLAPAGASLEVGLTVCLSIVLFHCPDGTDCLVAPYCSDVEEPPLGQERAAVSIPQDLETTTPTPQPGLRRVPTDFVVGMFIVALVIVIPICLVCFWKCCPKHFASCIRCLGQGRRENDALLDIPMEIRLNPLDRRPFDPRLPRRPLEICDSPPPLEEIPPPPPYSPMAPSPHEGMPPPPPYSPPLPPYSLAAPAHHEEIPPPPPYSLVAPSNHSHEEAGATVGPQRQALSGGGSEEPMTQSPMTSSATGPTEEPASAGDITLELGAAVAEEVTPVQGAAREGKATSTLDHSGRGEGASGVMSSAPAVTSTQPDSVDEIISEILADIWEFEQWL